MSLDQESIDKINETHHCPDCGRGRLLEGPWGGCSVNVKCDNFECRAEFWLGMHEQKVFAGGRIDRDCGDLYGKPLFSDDVSHS